MSLYQYYPSVELPHTDYSVTVTHEISKDDRPSNPATGNRLEVTIELRLRQEYALVLEPVKGQRFIFDGDFVVSPELTLQFKIPPTLVPGTSPDFLSWQNHVVWKMLESFPIDAGVRQFLRPHIVRNVGTIARKIGHGKQFKMVFSVMVTKIDLADAEECDKIRRGWSSLTGLSG